jgi:hypothetical protein
MSENSNIKEVIISASSSTIDDSVSNKEELIKEVECVKSLHEEVRELKEKLTNEHNTVQDLLKKLESKIEATSPFKLENPEIIVEKQPASTECDVKVDDKSIENENENENKNQNLNEKDEQIMDNLLKNLIKNFSGQLGCDFKVYKVDLDVLPNNQRHTQQHTQRHIQQHTQQHISIIDILNKAVKYTIDRIINIFVQISTHLLDILPIFFIFVQIFTRILIPFGNPFKRPDTIPKQKFE